MCLTEAVANSFPRMALNVCLRTDGDGSQDPASSAFATTLEMLGVLVIPSERA